jgi:hypothetical protein
MSTAFYENISILVSDRAYLVFISRDTFSTDLFADLDGFPKDMNGHSKRDGK